MLPMQLKSKIYSLKLCKLEYTGCYGYGMLSQLGRDREKEGDTLRNAVTLLRYPLNCDLFFNLSNAHDV